MMRTAGITRYLNQSRPCRREISAPRQALSGWSGRGHSGEANERRDADGDRADDGEDGLPGRRRHRYLRDSVRRAVTGDGRGRDVEQDDQDDQESKPRSRPEGERELANPEGHAACHEARGDSTERAGPAVESP